MTGSSPSSMSPTVGSPKLGSVQGFRRVIGRVRAAMPVRDLVAAVFLTATRREWTTGFFAAALATTCLVVLWMAAFFFVAATAMAGDGNKRLTVRSPNKI